VDEKKQAAIEAPQDDETGTRPASNRLPPSRQGKKAITAYVDPEMHKRLRLLGVELDKSTQEMIIEALDEYFQRQHENG